MAINVTPEEREIGQGNFHRVVGQLAEASQQGVTRRQFMKGLVAAGMVAPVSAAVYWGYDKNFLTGGKPAKPVRAALIGAGDEGGVLVGEHNPDFLEFVAVCDARPSNQKRIFTGDVDEKGKRKLSSPRKGFFNIPHYGMGKDAEKKIKVFDAIEKLFAADKDKSVEFDAVVIALPLHLHAPVAIAAMRAGKHVLCEKLMAFNIKECKRMLKVARETDRILCIGHQRHYSMLYAHAVEVLQSGVLGDVTHIRALWHRNNAIRLPDGSIKDGWKPKVPPQDAQALAKAVQDLYPEGYKSIEEMVRWRIHERTGGGLMAELGSHQLDASSIFLDAMARAGSDQLENGPHRDTYGSIREHVHPLAVSGVGMRTPLFVQEGWECDDQVFCSFEFPGKKYWADWKTGKVNDAHDRVLVTYSSINTSGFEPYGECVAGSSGTMIVDREQSIMLYPEGGARSTAVGVSTAGGGKPVLDTSGSPGGPAAVETGAKAIGSGPVSRGYREEMEDFAYCIRMWDKTDKNDRPLPRCHGQVAMGDAIIALTSNQAMAKQQRVVFRSEWFDPTNEAVPDADRTIENVKGKGFRADLYS